jgi:hypothetical protein
MPKGATLINTAPKRSSTSRSALVLEERAIAARSDIAPAAETLADEGKFMTRVYVTR